MLFVICTHCDQMGESIIVPLNRVNYLMTQRQMELVKESLWNTVKATEAMPAEEDTDSWRGGIILTLVFLENLFMSDKLSNMGQ